MKDMSKKKRKKRTVPTDRGRVVVFGGEPKMSEVILELADPLIDGDVSNPKEVDFIVQLTIAAWNKAMFPSDRQAAMEKEIIDTLVPPDGDAEQVGTIIQALEIVDDRRKKLFPTLRRFVLDYDLRVSKGKVALNVVSESMSENR
jgi:hypothetical protein